MNRRVIIAIFSALALASCIKNDLPKPIVDLYIASLDVEGTDGEIVIDRSTYTATIPLAEETDIVNVKFNSIVYDADVVTNVGYKADPSQIVASQELNGAVKNMLKPEHVTLSYFQSYEWTIVATQTINRIWEVDGQIGTTEWDLEGHRAIVRRRNDIKTDIKTKTLRMGPDNYIYPTCEEMDNEVIAKDSVCETIVVNNEVKHNIACKVKNISVIAHGRKEAWHMIVVPTFTEPEFKYIAAGANVVWIKANDVDGGKILFKYRKKGDTEWIDVNENWYATDAQDPYNRYETGYVKAILRGLTPSTEYEVQGWTIIEKGEEGTLEIPSKEFAVTTLQNDYQMPNSDMEGWSQYANDPKDLAAGKEGYCWYPFYSVSNMFWATGNPGSTALGANYNLTYPAYKYDNPDNVPNDSTGESSAYMYSRFVVIKLAAGNLFVGRFGGMKGMQDALVYFGQPITTNAKPVALRFKAKYNIGIIDKSDAAHKHLEGTPDLLKIFFCLTDWKEPHCVDSSDKSTFFDPRTANGILGLGYFDSDNNKEFIVEDTTAWHTITLPVEWKNPDVVPTHIVATFTCSGYGDYFTGSTNSWMYIDDVELLYDLDDNNEPK